MSVCPHVVLNLMLEDSDPKGACPLRAYPVLQAKAGSARRPEHVGSIGWPHGGGQGPSAPSSLPSPAGR